MTVERIGFDGANGDPIPAAWVQATVGGPATFDIQSLKARLVTGAVGSFGSNAAITYQRVPDTVTGAEEILFRLTPGQTWVTQAFLGISWMDIGLTNNYELVLDGNAPKLYLQRNAVDLVTPAVPTYTGSNAMWVRFRRFGNALFGKIWDDGSPEPGPWTISAVDTTPLAILGRPKIAANNGTAAASVTFSIDKVEINNFDMVEAFLEALYADDDRARNMAQRGALQAVGRGAFF